MKRRPSKKEMWFYAIGQLGWSILAGLISNLLVNYYLPDKSDVGLGGIRYFIPVGAIFLGLTVIGLITAVGRVVDAVTDPMIANWSDNCKHKLGKRIPFMRYAPIPFAVTTVLVFCATFDNPGVNVAWLAVTLLLFYVFMTAYCTPYNALLPTLGHDQKDRMNISTYISLTYIVGTGVAFGANMIWTSLANATGMDYYLAAKIVIGIEALIATICMLLPAYGIKETDYGIDDTPQENAFKSLGKTFKNKHFRLFVVSDVLYWVGITIFNTGFLYYVSNLLNCYSLYMLLFIFMTFVTFICYIPANILVQKVGKKKMVIIGFFAFALAFLVCAFAGKITFIPNAVYGFIICIFVGIPLAILGIVPQAIVADIAEQDAIKTGENHDGMFYAARTFAFKLGQGIAMIIFTSLAIIGTTHDLVSLSISDDKLTGTFNVAADANLKEEENDKKKLTSFETTNGGVVHDSEKGTYTLKDGKYVCTDNNGYIWEIVIENIDGANNISIKETKGTEVKEAKGTYAIDGKGTFTLYLDSNSSLQVGFDGLGYRISLVVALVFSVLAAVALFFYDEKNVMGTILEEHKKLESQATEKVEASNNME